jgi:hypothetical protein
VVVLHKPRLDTVRVENVFTRQFFNSLTLLEVFEANRALLASLSDSVRLNLFVV